jgi:hypothetical protein
MSKKLFCRATCSSSSRLLTQIRMIVRSNADVVGCKSSGTTIVARGWPPPLYVTAHVSSPQKTGYDDDDDDDGNKVCRRGRRNRRRGEEERKRQGSTARSEGDMW